MVPRLRTRRPTRRAGPATVRPQLGVLEDRITPTFPFAIQGSQFVRDGQPVFPVMLAYQPLEPGQAITGEIRETRFQDDLRRFRAYRGGSDPVLLRVYPQPTPEFPARLPKAFYDGVRDLGFWITRDIFFDDYDDLAAGRQKVDAVINEVAAAGAFDRIFAWEVGNEFISDPPPDPAAVAGFVCAMRDHVRARMAEPGREGFSNWVTWGSYPGHDPLRTQTGGNPIVVPCLDYVSYNAYSYDPERMRDHQAGPVTGTPYAGYLAALKERYPDKPLVVSETGLPDSPSTVDLDQGRLPPLYPAYRRGALTGEQVAEGLADRYWDARLSGQVAGVGFFEWNDEWHKVGQPELHNDDPEEYFGLHRFDPNGAGFELRAKVQQETVRDLVTLQYPSPVPVLTDVTADDAALPATGATTVRAFVSAGAVQPVRFRWESSRGYVVGDGSAVQFYAGGRALGPATVTVVAIDATGRATRDDVTIAIQPAGAPGVEVLTLSGGESGRASGRVANVDLTQFKLAVYVQTDQQYAQPFFDAKSIYVGPDGYWWTPVNNNFNGRLLVYVVPQSFVPPDTMPSGVTPPGTIAMAMRDTINDADADLVPDAFEPNVAQDRYSDPDADGATNLEEFLNGTQPAVADNDGDGDGLRDTFERRYFGRLSFAAGDDPDADGLTNQFEQAAGIHPGRTAVDRDRDQMPDRWEFRQFGNLAALPGDDPNQDGVTNLGSYELGLSPTAPRVVGLTVNDGAVQRSKVTQVTVTFAQVVTFAGNPAAAFRLTQLATGNDVVLAVDLSGSTATRTVARLTFSGPLTEHGSLKDGHYRLTVLAAQVGVGGQPLDGDGDGVAGGDSVSTLFRLFGDANGDGVINAFDYARFRPAFGSSVGQPGYVDWLDFDGDGFINAADFTQFRVRFGSGVP